MKTWLLVLTRLLKPSAEIAAGAMIGAGCFIGQHAKIGANTKLWSNVSIYHEVEIGSDCLIQANTVIGADGFGYAPHQGNGIKFHNWAVLLLVIALKLVPVPRSIAGHSKIPLLAMVVLLITKYKLLIT